MNQNLIRKADAPFTRWQRGLIFEPKVHRCKWDNAPSEVTEPIRKRQTELIKAVTDGPEELARYLRAQLSLEGSNKIEAPPFPREKLTASEYKEPPLELEEELGMAWKESLEQQGALASSPLFWLLCHIVWIEEGRLGGDGLALDEALLSGAQAREASIRNFLRRSGGLPHVRGNTSVFSDSPLARAWWRFNLADEVSKTTNGRIGRKAAHWLFHCHRQSWETLIMLSLKRITIINQPHARAAIAHHLGNRVQSNGRFDQKDVKTIATTLARVSLRRSLDFTPLKELYDMETGV